MTERTTLPDLTGTPPGGRMAALAVTALFAVAMAYVEASVVVYLREIYYPDGFGFPLPLIDRHVLIVEIAREAATIVMLTTVSWFAGRRLSERFAFFCFAFALWDIFYYVWLKVILDWPLSFLTPDVLFLIPLPWIGPVLSPVLVSLALIMGSLAIFRLLSLGGSFRPNWREWVIALGGAWLILLSYMSDLAASFGRTVPGRYRWELLVAGIAAGFYAMMRAVARGSIRERGSDE